MRIRTRPRTERHEERDIIQNAVCDVLDISRYKADTLKPTALLEILDISTLDDIARSLYGDSEERARRKASSEFYIANGTD